MTSAKLYRFRKTILPASTPEEIKKKLNCCVRTSWADIRVLGSFTSSFVSIDEYREDDCRNCKVSGLDAVDGREVNIDRVIEDVENEFGAKDVDDWNPNADSHDVKATAIDSKLIAFVSLVICFILHRFPLLSVSTAIVMLLEVSVVLNESCK